MRHFVVECVGPHWNLILQDGHRRIVGEVGVVQHLEHVVTSNLTRVPQSKKSMQTGRNSVQKLEVIYR